MILGYISSMTVFTQEGIDIFQAVNDFLHYIFFAKTIHKEEKPETNIATKPEPSSVKPNLPEIVKLCEQNKWESRNSKTKKNELYKFDLPNLKWTEEKFFGK